MTPAPRPRPLRGAALLCAGLLAGLPAAAEIVELRFDAAGRFSHAGSVAPGKFLELCGPLAQGAQVDWAFDTEATGATLDFNVHYHEGKNVVYPARLKQVARASDRLAVRVAQDYCWMWSNKGSTPVTVSARLQRL